MSKLGKLAALGLMLAAVMTIASIDVAVAQGLADLPLVTAMAAVPALSPEEQTELLNEIKDEVKTSYTKLDDQHKSLQEIVDELKKKAANDDDMTDLKNTFKDVETEIKKLSEHCDELDKKFARPRNAPGGEIKSVGAEYVATDEYAAWCKKGTGSCRIETKAITNVGNEVGGQTLNALVPRQHLAGVIQEPDQPLTVRDLLPTGTTTSNSIEYARETLFDNQAAPVAENTLKPESNITYTLETANVRTIAHWIPVSKQALADAPMLRSMIDGRLRYGLAFTEEQQLLLGDGTGQNLNGIKTQAVAFNQSVGANGIPGGLAATPVDIIRWVKLQVRKSFYAPTAVLLNPEDWAKIELQKDADNNYMFSAFTSGADPRLWGLRVVECDSIAVGEFLVGAFSLGAQIWDREQAAVEISTEDRDNFVKNMCTLRGEERLALTVYRPSAFMDGTFTLVA